MRSPIVPFLGYRMWEHDPVEGVPRILSVCDMDSSGTKTYHFNSLGFRGEEFKPDASKRIFVCGCSYTFGVGLNFEETTAYKFKRQYCDYFGFSDCDVNMLNFAMPGGSNDYIARTLLTQCSRLKPDVLVAIFTHQDRAEHIDEDALGQRVWTAAPWWIREVGQEIKPPDASAGEQIEVMRQASLGYFYYATQSNSASNLLRNVLLLQFYCELHRIPYIFHRMDFANFSSLENHFALTEMALLVDQTHFPSYNDPDRFYCDTAADGAHPGAQSNSNIADALFSVYRSLYCGGA
jgi:hypothetical protein